MLFRLKATNFKNQAWYFGHKLLLQNQSKVLPNLVNFSSQQNDVKSNSNASSERCWDDATQRKWVKPIIYSGIALFAGFLSYKYLNEKEVNPLDFFSPAVNAAVATMNESSNRKRFNFFADIVDRASPAVVYIEIKDKRHVDYFTREPVTASNGSGFIVDPNGLILTNAHVVINKPHTYVQVRLQDGRTFVGMVDSVDPVSDLATVKINW